MRKNTQQVSEMLHSHQAQARYILVFLMLSALVVSFVCSALMMPAVSMEAPKYDKAYTIENILSSYNLFVENDLTAGNHVVGAMAAGNNLTGISASGDAAKAPSYAKNIIKMGNYSCGSYLEDADRENLAFYYQTTADGVSLGTGYEQVSESYIDFEQAFQNIRAWSQGKAKETGSHVWIVQDSDLSVSYSHQSGWKLDIDVKTLAAKDIIIPKEIYDKVGVINFIGSGGATEDEIVEAMARNGYTITFPGVTDPAIRFDYTSTDKRVTINEQAMENKFKNLTGEIHKGEANFDGTNLIWNFPDATELAINYLSGHLVAPNATAYVNCRKVESNPDGYLATGGNFEGNVIAKNAFTGGEAHFYSYYGIKSDKPMDISVEKQWKGDPEGTTHQADSIQVQLYKSENAVKDLDALTDAQKSGDPVILNSENDWTYKWENVEKGFFYYVKELNVPDGYAVSYSGNGLSTVGMIVITNTSQTTVVTTTVTTGTTTTTVSEGSTTTTTAATTTTTVTTTTTAVATTTTEAATTTTRGISIGVHKIWSDGASSHDGDTVVVEIHRSTDPADVPEQAKITTGAAATTTAAAATTTIAGATTTAAASTTTGKDPPSGADQSGSASYDGSQLVIPINGGTDTKVKSIVLEITGYTGCTGGLHVEFLQSKDVIDYWGKRACFKFHRGIESAPVSCIDAENCTVVQEGNTVTITGISSNINRIHLRLSSDLHISFDYTITYASDTAAFDTDTIKPVLAGSNASPTWVQDLEIRKDSGGGWSAAAEDLPAADPEGNPYYYWIVETDFTGYDASYLYENSPGDRYITGKDGSVTVCNTKSAASVVMPSTGGSGTFAYRFIGVCLMTGTAGLYLLRRRKRRCSSA